MKKITITKAELDVAAEKIGLTLNADVAEATRAMVEEWQNDANALEHEMMKPEYDDLFPASIVSVLS